MSLLRADPDKNNGPVPSAANRVRYILGLLAILSIVGAVFFINPPSLTGWQSVFLGRALFIILLCVFFCLLRILFGPTAADRAVALNIFGILILGLCAAMGIPTGREWYIDIGIAWALQSFISILVIGKYFEGKDFDD